MSSGNPATGPIPAEQIDVRTVEIGDWRDVILARVRAAIQAEDPDVQEEWKWRGVPVWCHEGMLWTGETYKAAVKLTFAKGAAFPDPSGLFNASLDGNVRCAIDFHEGEELDGETFAARIRAAVTLNQAKPATRRRGSGSATTT
jgi:hypothetical protein